jgi:hypothetical protein
MRALAVNECPGTGRGYPRRHGSKVLNLQGAKPERMQMLFLNSHPLVQHPLTFSLKNSSIPVPVLWVELDLRIPKAYWV